MSRADRDVARELLAGVRLERLIGEDGAPTPDAFHRFGMLSSGEQVLVALALAILDYQPRNQVCIGRLMGLDRANLRRVGEALIALTEDDQ